jgi:cell wall-associated NlpC family hydrolase
MGDTTTGAIGPRRVSVEVATMWTSPDAPRPVDEPAVSDEPDLAAWTSALDTAARLDLHDRTETQLHSGEPVVVVETGPPGWVRVVAPWQPSPKDPRGYPGWVRRSHLEEVGTDIADLAPRAAFAARPLLIADWARRFVGLPYLWGGTSRYGFDCSGLVHLAFREAGIVVPRDASAQHAAARPVELGRERAGDLYFFAGDDGHVVHVGFATGPRWMLHAPETGKGIEETPLTPRRRAALIGAGRLLV